MEEAASRQARLNCIKMQLKYIRKPNFSLIRPIRTLITDFTHYSPSHSLHATLIKYTAEQLTQHRLPSTITSTSTSTHTHTAFRLIVSFTAQTLIVYMCECVLSERSKEKKWWKARQPRHPAQRMQRPNKRQTRTTSQSVANAQFVCVVDSVGPGLPIVLKLDCQIQRCGKLYEANTNSFCIV